MTDRPIIFSAPMARALLDGRKTMTRRLAWRWVKDHADRALSLDDADGTHQPSPWQRVQPGDRLWVRENWRPGAWRDGHVAVDYQASPDETRTPWLAVPEAQWRPLWLRMGEEAEKAVTTGRGSARRNPDADGWTWDRGDSPCRWRPSIHMPRWASRLTLTVTAVRVERLQAITNRDCIAEGMPPFGPENPPDVVRDEFRALWNHLHGEDAWDANPEVVALSFTVERRNIGA